MILIDVSFANKFGNSKYWIHRPFSTPNVPQRRATFCHSFAPKDDRDMIQSGNEVAADSKLCKRSRTLNTKPDQPEIFAELFDQLPDEKFAKPQLGVEHESNVDVAAAFSSALAEPFLYPPLEQSVFPGDDIAIVLQSDLPHAKLALQSLLDQLYSLKIEPADIAVVITARTAAQLEIDPKLIESEKEQLAEGTQPGTFPHDFGKETINFQVHDTENPAGHSYLAANADALPVHVNRLLVDADVVLPIGWPWAGEADQQTDCIYPDFSNESTLSRFHKRKKPFLTRWSEIQLANDTLGAFFTIQLVCGPGDSIHGVVAGSRNEVVKLARDRTNQLWRFNWDQDDVEMTIATIESEADDQNWDDFANALITASRVTSSDGPIVIWSDISVPASREIRKALMSQFENEISTKLNKTNQHVAAIVNERPVYLRCGLAQNAVEELGLGFIQDVSEILQISQSRKSGLLIRDAHKCQTSVKAARMKDQ